MNEKKTEELEKTGPSESATVPTGEPKRVEGDRGATPEGDDSSDAVTAEFERVQKELLYLRAEFENYKKRVLREQEQMVRFANERLLRDLLSILDLLERGLTHGRAIQSRSKNGDQELASFVDGVGMTQRELVQLLGRFGVELVGVVGEKFDPAKHEAVSQQKTGAEGAGKVIEVLQKGCLLHGRLLVPARVVVGVAEV